MRERIREILKNLILPSKHREPTMENLYGKRLDHATDLIIEEMERGLLSEKEIRQQTVRWLTKIVNKQLEPSNDDSHIDIAKSMINELAQAIHRVEWRKMKLKLTTQEN